jgi:tRNA1Val (adenine37-N6)-methyltransferase
MKTIHENFIAHKSSLEERLGEPLTVDGIAGPLRIFQRERGHRHSIDDALTACYALQKSPPVNRALDLGTGIGSVGLAVLWGLGPLAHLTCVEAQEISYTLLQANITCNELDNRVNALHGDLRTLELSERFPLITGSPPYFPEGTGVLPDDSQKAYARFELRGDVSDYARAAKKHLSEDGLFVFCFPYQQKARCIRLVTETGFKIVSIRDVIPNPKKGPLFSLYAARLDWKTATIEETPLVVSDDTGAYTPEMVAFQNIRGFGALGSNVLS